MINLIYFFKGRKWLVKVLLIAFFLNHSFINPVLFAYAGIEEDKLNPENSEYVEKEYESGYDSLLNQNNEKSNEDTESPEKKSEIKNDKRTKLKGYVSKIPSGTKLSIIFESPVDEITSMIDDEVTARISKDIVIDGQTVAPAGSTVIGIISEVNPARRMHKSGNVRIEFKSLTIPDGRQIPIVASVLTRSGLIKGKLTKKAALISTATVVGPAAAGFGAGLAAEGSPVGGLIGAAVGVVLGLGLFAFQRGNKVDIKAGDEIDIELVEEALLPLTDAGGDQSEIEKSETDRDNVDVKDDRMRETDFTEDESPTEDRDRDLLSPDAKSDTEAGTKENESINENEENVKEENK